MGRPLSVKWLPRGPLCLCFCLSLCLCLLALEPLQASAAGARPAATRALLQAKKTLQLRKMAQEYNPPPCAWCHGLSDGMHPDTGALPPCSGYFTCEDGQLAHMDACPQGLCFDKARGHCVERSLCSCTAEGAASGGTTPGVYQGKQLRGHGRPQGAHAHLDGASEPALPRRSVLRRPGRGGMDYLNGTQWPQVNALLAFKRANWDPMGLLASWVVPPHSASPAFVCKWKWVTCKGADIVALEVNQGGNPQTATQPLFGDTTRMQSIPPQFGSLTALTVLDLSYLGAYQAIAMGGLVGSLPSELGRLTNLVSINVRYNALAGELPESLSRLQALTFLQLAYNLFQGTFPSVLSTLGSLAYLSMVYNGFSGPLPEGISSLQSLTKLVVAHTAVSGRLPLQLGALSGLQELSVTYNPALSGGIPGSISRLRSLQLLEFQGMGNLTGKLPSARLWSRLTSLTKLTLQSTSLTGSLPTRLPLALQYMTVSESRVSGSIPVSLIRSACSPKRKVLLAKLDLGFNRLTGSLPEALSRCTGLQILNVSGNAMEGRIPPTLLPPLATNLFQFDVSHNNFSGTFPKEILKTLGVLGAFSIGSNRFSGTPPATLHASSSLSRYDVSNNNFKGDIADVLRLPAGVFKVALVLSNNSFEGSMPKNWAKNVEELRLDGNAVSGPLPDPGDCADLKILSTSGNRFTGGIPSGLLRKCPLLEAWGSVDSGLSGPIPSPGPKAASTNLKQLLLAGNKLSGPFPRGLQHLNSLRGLDVSRNALEGPLPDALTDLVLLSTLDASANKLSGALPPELRVLQQLSYLALDCNQLSGPIPPELAPPNLLTLRTFNLSFNALNGTIPWGFANASLYGIALNLSHNSLSGQVPGYDTGPLASDPSVVAGNEGLCGGAGYPACPSSGLSAGALAGIIIGSVLFAGLVGAGIAWWLAGRRNPWNGVLMVFREFDPPLTIKTILDVTDRFSDEFLLGRGGFGSVYKAELPDGTIVAIKRLAAGSTQGDEEFKAEVQCLGSLKHKNIVGLVAAFVATRPSTERLLVYEFLSGGSLDQCIVEDMPEDSPYRKFKVRRSIVTDVARGLKYLHHDVEPAIIHRDMKPANVLMDENLVAMVADFGLAKTAAFEEGKAHMTVEEIFGTAGYVAPEYNSLGRVSCKSDVYAYGVTLIQIISGRRTTDSDIVEQGLQRWANSAGAKIVDPNLDLKDDNELALAMGAVKIGVLCTARVPVDRPSMLEVVRMLENLEEFVGQSPSSDT